MKKILCLLLAIMVIGLCGCGGNGGNEETGPAFSLGTTTNNTYKNDFLGISCTLPSEWVFYTDEEILALNNIVGDMVDKDIADKLKDANIIYDMYASNSGMGNTININMEKLTALQLKVLNMKTTLEAQIDTIKSAYQNMGYSNIVAAYQKITVDGKEFDSLRITASYQGVNLYVTAFSFVKGSYMAKVTVSGVQTDITDTILGYFTVK